jgi:hypothetical protein
MVPKAPSWSSTLPCTLGPAWARLVIQMPYVGECEPSRHDKQFLSETSHHHCTDPCTISHCHFLIGAPRRSIARLLSPPLSHMLDLHSPPDLEAVVLILAVVSRAVERVPEDRLPGAVACRALNAGGSARVHAIHRIHVFALYIEARAWTIQDTPRRILQRKDRREQ